MFTLNSEIGVNYDERKSSFIRIIRHKKKKEEEDLQPLGEEEKKADCSKSLLVGATKDRLEKKKRKERHAGKSGAFGSCECVILR